MSYIQTGSVGDPNAVMPISMRGDAQRTFPTKTVILLGVGIVGLVWLFGKSWGNMMRANPRRRSPRRHYIVKAKWGPRKEEMETITLAEANAWKSLLKHPNTLYPLRGQRPPGKPTVTVTTLERERWPSREWVRSRRKSLPARVSK